MTREDLPSLFTQRGLLGDGVEIGADIGGFAATILEHWPGRHLTLVDSWSLYYRDMFGHERMELADRRMARFNGRATLVRGLSAATASQFTDGSLDWFYLDADHGYAPVMADLEAWYPKLKPGGIAAGHDYMDVNEGSQWPASASEYLDVDLDPRCLIVFGVRSAVRDFRIKNRVTSELKLTDDWPRTFYWVK